MSRQEARRVLDEDGRAPLLERAVAWRRLAQGPGACARSLCVASGKGGTGKSVVTASLAACLSEAARVLLVDVDLGVGNAHILQDVAPARSLVDLVEGRASVRDVLAPCGPRLDLLAAGSGVSHMAQLAAFELAAVAGAIEELERGYAWVLADAGAGISGQTVAMAAACDRSLIVTTPDVTAITDAYAFLKVLWQRDPGSEPLLVVNRASSADEARSVAERLVAAARKFLSRELTFLGWLPEDRAVPICVNARAPVVTREPGAPFACAARELAAALEARIPRTPTLGFGGRLARAAVRDAV
jgi:flagellar biosynthesis protein FlhG